MADLKLAIEISLSADTLAILRVLAEAVSRTPLATVHAEPAPRAKVQPEQMGPSPRAAERQKYKGWCTAERADLMRELWPTSLPKKQIVARLAALPGPPLPPHPAVTNKGWLMGLNRPAALVPKQLPAARKRAAKSPDVQPPAPSNVAVMDVIPAEPQAAEPTAPPAEPPAETVMGSTLKAALSKVAEHFPAPAVSWMPSAPRIPALPASVPQPAANQAPIVAGQEAIRQKAAAWGIHMGTFDLEAVNRKARDLGHPGFALKLPERRGAVREAAR